MLSGRFLLGAALALSVLLTSAARAADTVSSDSPMELCRGAIAAAEQANPLPDRLLEAIGLIESGRADPATGRRGPWPWTINAEGVGRFFTTEAEAIAAVQALQARGVRSVDVGCMQINLLFHPDAFASLEEAFDPGANVAYAARFLNSLYAESGDWLRAATSYHSRTPEFAAAYAASLAVFWPGAGTGGAGISGADFAPAALAGIAAPFAALLREPGPALLRDAVRLPAAVPGTTVATATTVSLTTAAATPSRDGVVALPPAHGTRIRSRNGSATR